MEEIIMNRTVEVNEFVININNEQDDVELVYLNQSTGKKSIIRLTDETLIKLFTGPDQYFDFLHFIAWLNGTLPDEIATTTGLNSDKEMLRKQIKKSLFIQGIHFDTLEEMESELLEI